MTTKRFVNAPPGIAVIPFRENDSELRVSNCLRCINTGHLVLNKLLQACAYAQICLTCIINMLTLVCNEQHVKCSYSPSPQHPAHKWVRQNIPPQMSSNLLLTQYHLY